MQHSVLVTGFHFIRVYIFGQGHDPAELQTLEEVERRYILHVLHAVGDNRTLAARVLGLDRKTLWRKLQRYAQATESDSAQ